MLMKLEMISYTWAEIIERQNNLCLFNDAMAMEQQQCHAGHLASSPTFFGIDPLIYSCR